MGNQAKSNMIPFRDTDNKGVAYGENPTASSPSLDSDAELLNPPQSLDEDAMQHFTATGRPAPKFKAHDLISLVEMGFRYSMPQLLPKRYTDDSIIPAIVTDVVLSEKPAEEEGTKKKGGFFGKFKGKKGGDELDALGQKKGITRVVYMPRRDYLKYFTKDKNGDYIGSEPYRRWTEEELEEQFAKYKPAVGKK